MSKSDKKIIWIILVVIAVLYLSRQTTIFSIVNLESPLIQYNNQPIEVIFSSNISNPSIEVFFNEQQLYKLINQTEGDYNLGVNGNNYIITYDTAEKGLFKIVVAESNISDVITIEIKNPYITVKHDIPSSVEQGDDVTITIQPVNPQGEPEDADSVDIDVTGPDNKKQTIFMNKVDDVFKANYEYGLPGNYIFKIHARKLGFDTKEGTAITAALKRGRIHPILFLWIGVPLLFILLLIIKKVRKRSLRR